MPVPKLLLHTNDFYSTQILTNDILCVVAVLKINANITCTWLDANTFCGCTTVNKCSLK